ncbi:MAG: response regulator [Acidobacteriota bacterium]|jgi:CheY-like chemotaxis protein
MTGTHETGSPIDLEGISRQEPEVAAEQTQPFENAALIGGEKLRSSGFFVNIVRRGTATDLDGASPLVLVVEDDAGTAGVIEAILTKRGFSTRLAANLQETTRALKTKPAPHVVLLDILLPDANGFAILERLRRHPDFGRLPVVMLTSLSEPADVAKGLALGANGYLSKPARPQALVAALRSVLGFDDQG